MAGILAAYDSALATSCSRGETDYGCASLHALADTIMASEELAAVVPDMPGTGATPQLGDWAARARRVQPVESADEAFAGAFRLAPLDAACDTAAACSLLQAGAALSTATPCFEMTVQALDGADMAVGVAAAAPPQQLTAASMPALAESLVRAGDFSSSAARFAIFWAADGQLLLTNVVATHKERTLGSKTTVSTMAAPFAAGSAQPQVRASCVCTRSAFDTDARATQQPRLPSYTTGDRVGIAMRPSASEDCELELAFFLNGTFAMGYTFATSASGGFGVRGAACCYMLHHAHAAC
jgi:hypothetical protein